jgi:two-component system sensor kinase FixL
MSATSMSMVEPGQADGVAGPQHLVPRPGAGFDPETTAWWALDVSEARSVIAAITSGAEPALWIDALLAGVRIADVDQNNIHLVGPYAGRRRMIGQPFSTYCPPESWRPVAELILAVIADHPAGAPRRRPITSIAFADAWLQASGDEAHPDMVFLAVGGRVVDERSLWAVRASEERYRNLIHHLPCALLQVDSRPMRPIFDDLRSRGVTDIAALLDAEPERALHSRDAVRVTDANNNAVRLFGADHFDQLIGPVDFVFAAAPETAKRVITAHFNGVRTHREVMKVRRFDGELRDVELTVTYPTPPERLDITLLTLDDITDRRRTAAQLRELQAEYSRAARISTMGELATSIAHEVNQPLSAIVTNAETSLRWLSRPDPNLAKIGQLTTRIAESARHASRIVQRIRGMVAPRAPERVLLDLNGIVEEALHFVRHEIESRAIGLSLRLDHGLPRLFGDRVQLQQVVVNLLLNAVQAIGQSEQANGRIDIRTMAGPPGQVSFSVHDDGPGIAEENLDRVFGSFFTTKAEGMGMGLAICQSIVTAHGGTITVSNHTDGGALFRFVLPTAETADS